MSLTDVMSGSGLALYAEIALILFVTIFAVVLGTIVKKTHREAWEHAKNLPLDGEGTHHASAEE